MEQAWWYPLYKQEITFPESSVFKTNYIHRLAAYSRQNPSHDEDPPALAQVLAGHEQGAEFLERLTRIQRDRLRRISLMVERHTKQ